MSRVVHFEIYADNPARAQRFYESVFGWLFMKFGDEDYWLVTTGPEDEPGINGGLMPRQTPVSSNDVIAWVCTIDVESIDDALDAVKQHGGEQVVDKTEIPGVGTYAYCKDTELNIFGLMQSAQ